MFPMFSERIITHFDRIYTHPLRHDIKLMLIPVKKECFSYAVLKQHELYLQREKEQELRVYY